MQSTGGSRLNQMQKRPQSCSRPVATNPVRSNTEDLHLQARIRTSIENVLLRPMFVKKNQIKKIIELTPSKTMPKSCTFLRSGNVRDQARFQQRQMEEKEQKLVRMYEAAQARALGRLAGPAAPAPAPASLAPLAPPGKVRQMFEERRTKAGIDKSYPLQPLSRARPVHSDGDHPRPRPRPRPQPLPLPLPLDKQHKRSHRDDLPVILKTHMTLRDHNANESDSVDGELLGDSAGEPDSEAVRLPNVGGSLPSQRPGLRHRDNNNQPPQTPNIKNGVKKPAENGRADGDARDKKLSPVTKPLGRTAKAPLPPAPARRAAPPAARTAPPPSPPKAAPIKAAVHKSPIKTAPTAMATKATKNPPSTPGSGKPPPGHSQCRICHRNFASDRIQVHEDICSKAANKKRKQYDALKHRVQGTEAETYVVRLRKSARSTNTLPARIVSPPLKKSNWRKKHEEFIQTIRAAKQVQDHISKGGKLSDLPPPPPSENADYVACPHCGRRFNEAAAERHIPKCADFQFNKPKQGTAAKKR